MIDDRAPDRLDELLPAVVALAHEAGSAIMAFYNQPDPGVAYKHDNSPLTLADLAAHNVIMGGLARIAPDWPILSEESPPIPFAERENWRYFWMVDPLDGTKDFLRRSREFTVNIALIDRHTPILGVVYAPAFGKMYYAARQAGVFRAAEGSVVPIKAVPARTSALRTVVSHSHRSSSDMPAKFGGLSGHGELSVIASSLKFCLIAEGTADFYPRAGPTMEWDTAAAHCILEEAGGSVTDLDGNSISYNKPSLVNPGFLARGPA
jgi:3'(2'), 5'-bisphosphate nucleotidase